MVTWGSHKPSTLKTLVSVRFRPPELVIYIKFLNLLKTSMVCENSACPCFVKKYLLFIILFLFVKMKLDISLCFHSFIF